ncbi:hypothetical protein SAMN05216319_4727 [Duganella sp. CF402]|uniref:hypothetical protein n=1 Tax=unclassified Duganella TaxID=2636909 RepID=UPI0008AF36DE|nr:MULTISPECIES: hypothetical protein [unclassified Duganella]RZT06049.1 hypothetical protein EV582_4374 [Duganella sp. BK701]SEM77999.1 hypothetical protein SAMN05216319_4727 [Duganella sp. CF402]
MDPQIVERVSTLETDVAVIQSNYVRRDEFAELREELRVGFAKTDTNFAKTDTNFAKTDTNFAKADAKVDCVHEELLRKMDAGFARLEIKIERTTNSLLRWMFASQISVAAMFIAVVKYL